VVGTTRNAIAVTEFELLFREIGSITSVLNFVISNNFMSHTERHLQHALSITRRTTFNCNLLDFVLELQKPSAAKSIFCNSQFGRSDTQPTYKGDC